MSKRFLQNKLSRLQGARDSRGSAQFRDNRSSVAAKLKNNNSGNAQFMDNRQGVGQMQDLEGEELLQGKFDPVQKQPNNTGLPNNLKAGIENLSGISMDGAKVHQNYSKSAEVGADAYAQGTDIHVAPGQMQHLPHEAWHVVQQAQGRVSPTMSVDGMEVNNDVGLESEADLIGSRAIQFKASFSTSTQKTNIPLFTTNMRGNSGIISPLQPTNNSTQVLQGFFEIDSDSFSGYITEQSEKQQIDRADLDTIAKENVEPFTTVGFEAEFAQTVPSDNPLAGLSHLVLAETEEPPMAYTDLGFVLETDADRAIELVTPPFLVRTAIDRPIPLAEDIAKIDGFIRAELESIAERAGDIGGLEEMLQSDAGIKFQIHDAVVESKNLSMDSLGKYGKYKKVTPASSDEMMAWINGELAEDPQITEEHEDNSILEESLKGIGVQVSKKGGGITTQVNFATDLQTFAQMSEIGGSNIEQDTDGTSSLKNNIIGAFMDLEGAVSSLLDRAGLDGRYRFEGNEIFRTHVKRQVAGQMAVPFIGILRNFQEEMYQNKNAQRHKFPGGSKDRKLFLASGLLSSIVKDIDQVWLKETLLNVLLSHFGSGPVDIWRSIHRVCRGASDIMDSVERPMVVEKGTFLDIATLKNINNAITKEWKPIKNAMKESLDRIAGAGASMSTRGQMSEPGPGWEDFPDDVIEEWVNTEVARRVEEDPEYYSSEEEKLKLRDEVEAECQAKIPFLSHYAPWITPRQDTMINSEKAQVAYWAEMGLRLHVVESRTNSVEMIEALNKKNGL